MKRNNLGVYKTLFLVFKNLNHTRKKQIFIFFIFISFSAFIETLSLASAIPFFNFLINPNANHFENNFIETILRFFNIYYPENLILSVSILLAISTLIASSTKILSLWFGSRLSGSIGVDLSSECFKRYLFRNYEEHLISNSSQLLSTNTTFVNRTVELLAISTRFFISIISGIFISIFLFIYNPTIAFSSVLIFSLIYFLLGSFLRTKLTKNSRTIAHSGQDQIKLMQESVGGIREIILDNSFLKYLSIFVSLDKEIRLSIANNEFINLFPRYAIEGIFIILLCFVSISLSINSNNLLEVFSVLGIFAIGAQKLLPSMQQCYSSWSYLRGNIASISNVLSMIQVPLKKSNKTYKSDKLLFENKINFKNIKYCYKSTSKTILRKVDLEIQKGERIGLVGKTGSGKSTLIDLLIGLLYPTNGTIEIDGVDIFDEKYPDRIIEWRKQISHVPQNIFLTDATIAENIAFGIDLKNIDLKKIRRVAKAASIDDFISNTNNMYKSLVGENGVQLSGGQRQRIAIARALYKDAKIIVFDEATSSLDIKTEEKIMDTIYNLKRDITIFIITHRESTISKCDKVFELNDGIISQRSINSNR